MTPATPQSAASPVPGSTARAAVEALFRHRTTFLVTTAVVLLATILVTMATPRTYESEMNILVRNARPDYLISPERNSGQVVQRDVTEERINSEIDVLRSKDVADVVVDPQWSVAQHTNTQHTDAQHTDAQHTDAEIKAHEKAVTAYSKDLTVEPLHKSNVIRVAYLARDPHQATATVERLLAAFMAKQREIERATGTSAFFATEAGRYKLALDRAQQDLAAYQQGNHIVSLPEKETTLDTQITALEDEMRSTQVQLTEAANRTSSDQRQLALLPPRLSTQQRSVPNTQAVEQLTAILINYQNKRTELLTRYQPGDRLLAEVDQQIATTTAALATARDTNGQESTTDINPVYQQLRAALAIGTTELAALRGRLADLTAQRDRLRQQLGDIEGSTVDYTTLQSRVTELEANYQLYSQKKTEAQIADAMDQQQLVNVAVAERPTFSAKPYRPQVLINLALGTFTAFFFALCAVFFAELARDTIAAPCELEAFSTARVLATIPLLAQPHIAVSPGDNTRGTPERRPRKPAPAAPETSGGIASIAARSILEPPPTLIPNLIPSPAAAVTVPEPRLQRAHLQSFEQLSSLAISRLPDRPIPPSAPPPVPPAAPPVTPPPAAATPLDATHRQLDRPQPRHADARIRPTRTGHSAVQPAAQPAAQPNAQRK